MREFLSPQEILKLFEQDPQRTFRLRELVLELGLRSSQARELKSLLKDLARSKKLVYLKKNHYALVHKGRYAAASEAVAAVSDRSRGGQTPPLQTSKSPNEVGARHGVPLRSIPPAHVSKSPNFVSRDADGLHRLRALPPTS